MENKANKLLSRINNERAVLKKNKIIRSERISNELDIKQELYDLPKDWTWCKVSDIIYTTSISKYQIKQSEVQKKGSIPVVSQSKNRIEGYSNRLDKVFNVDHPVIIFGDHTRVIKYVDFDFIVGADGVKIIHPILVNPKFLEYSLRNIVNKMINKGYSRHFQYLQKSWMPLPDLDIQVLLVERIESQFEKIDTTMKDLENAKKKSELYRLQLLEYAISGRLMEQLESDGAAEELYEDIQEEKEKLIKEKKIKQEKYQPIEEDEIPFEIPKSWKWCRLYELLLKHVGGGTPSRRIQSYWNGNIPWASVKDLNCINLTNTLEAITEEGLNNSSSNVIKKGNIIVCTRVGVGKIVFNDIDVAINQDLRGLFLNNKILMKFFYYYYLTLDFKGRGTTVKGISVNELKNTLVPLPPLAEQKRIVEILEKKLSIIDNNIKLIDNMLKKCDLLKQSILNQFFGGHEE